MIYGTIVGYWPSAIFFDGKSMKVQQTESDIKAHLKEQAPSHAWPGLGFQCSPHRPNRFCGQLIELFVEVAAYNDQGIA
jgi:hypothetical protein